MSYTSLDYINKVREELCARTNALQQTVPEQASQALWDLTDKEKTPELSFLTADEFARLLGQDVCNHPIAMIDAIRHVEEATRIYRDLKTLKRSRTERLLDGLSGLNAQRNMMRYFIKYTNAKGSADNSKE